MRVQMMYSNSVGFITATLAIWTIATGIICSALKENTLCTPWFTCIVLFLMITPAIIAIPISIKSGDNLSRVAQLSAFIRVFFELPSLINEKEDGCFVYETALGAAVHDNKNGNGVNIKLFNVEFFFVVLLSIALTTSLLVYYCLSQYVLGVIIAGVFIALQLYILFIVRKASSVNKNFLKARTESISDFIKIAISLEIISADNAKSYEELCQRISLSSPIKEVVCDNGMLTGDAMNKNL